MTSASLQSLHVALRASVFYATGDSMAWDIDGEVIIIAHQHRAGELRRVVWRTTVLASGARQIDRVLANMNLAIASRVSWLLRSGSLERST